MSATTLLYAVRYREGRCNNEEFPAATFGKCLCNFRDLALAKNNSNEILEPYCSLEEVLGIINSVETCLEMITKYGKSRETEVGTEERKFDCAGVIIGQQKE